MQMTTDRLGDHFFSDMIMPSDFAPGEGTPADLSRFLAHTNLDPWYTLLDRHPPTQESIPPQQRDQIPVEDPNFPPRWHLHNQKQGHDQTAPGAIHPASIQMELPGHTDFAPGPTRHSRPTSQR